MKELFLILVGCLGLLFLGLGIPLVQRWVKPNWLYGFRTPKTLSNPEIWYDANAYAGKCVVGAGFLIVAVAIGLYFVPGLHSEVYALISGAVVVLSAIAMLVLSLLYLGKFDQQNG